MEIYQTDQFYFHYCSVLLVDPCILSQRWKYFVGEFEIQTEEVIFIAIEDILVCVFVLNFS